MSWWIWILAGIALLAFEVMVPGGIILLFFGVAAIVVGLLVAIGIGGPAWFQAALFSVFSVVSLLTLRGPILKRMKASSWHADKIDTLRGQKVLLIDDLAPGGEGQAELRGTAWIARNIGEQPLAGGQQGVVERVEGVKLLVRGIS